MTNFSFEDVEVPSKVCVCASCKTRGYLNQDFLINVLEIDKRTKQPALIAILCKKCLAVERWLYADYLRAVNLKPIGD